MVKTLTVDNGKEFVAHRVLGGSWDVPFSSHILSFLGVRA
jgi:IS30 family transposase